MTEQFDLAAETSAAWGRFRGRLADRLAGLEDDEVLRVEVETGADEDDLDGAAPYLQFGAWGGDQLRAEAVSNHHLDDRYALSEEDDRRVVAAGWEAPDDVTPNYHLDLELREADRAAWMSVAVLREVYAVAHPAFLDAEGLELDPDVLATTASAGPSGRDEEPETEPAEQVATFPHSRDELVTLVDAAIAVMIGREVTHDDDGDIPIVAGQSIVFVRVLPDRPALDLFAEIVVDVQDTDRLALELELLNRGHECAQFYRREDTVIMKQQLPAMPFAPAQLRSVLAEMASEVDDVALALALRVDGRRFFDRAPDDTAPADRMAAGEDAHPGMVSLLELMHLDVVGSPAVAALFEHDRLEIIRQIVRVRTQAQGCDEHDADLVLDHLRRGLRYVVDGEVPERRGRRLPPKPRSQQPSLLTDEDAGEESLDLGWSA